MDALEEEFLEEAIIMYQKSPGLIMASSTRRFRAMFGVSSKVCAMVWSMLCESLPSKCKPVHLLWALLFLKVYASEHVNSAICGVDEKTFRKWSWLCIRKIADMGLIKLDTRLPPESQEQILFCGKVCHMSVDGTDCRIQEPFMFNRKWYSHKFNGPGLRYEVGVSIHEGNISWVYGPFPCGSHPDVKIFHLGLKNKLIQEEQVCTDDGYQDERCIRKVDLDSRFEDTRKHSLIRARHETVNRRLKQFFVLSHRFRHKVSMHGYCFHAVAQLTHVMIATGEGIFNVS